MTIVTAQMSVSADGFSAGPKHTGRQTWLEGPQAAGFFRVTRWAIDAEAWRQRLGFKGGEENTNSEVIAETFESAGAYVMGRRMADGGEMIPPSRAPVFVVTSRPRLAGEVHRHTGQRLRSIAPPCSGTDHLIRRNCPRSRPHNRRRQPPCCRAPCLMRQGRGEQRRAC